MNNEYYLLQRNNEYQVISVTPGNDPLYGNGSCNLADGPFPTWEDAANAAPLDILNPQDWGSK